MVVLVVYGPHTFIFFPAMQRATRKQEHCVKFPLDDGVGSVVRAIMQPWSAPNQPFLATDTPKGSAASNKDDLTPNVEKNGVKVSQNVSDLAAIGGSKLAKCRSQASVGPS